MTLCGLRVAAAALVVWNAVTWVPQVLLLRHAGRVASLWGLNSSPLGPPQPHASDTQLSDDPEPPADAGQGLKERCACGVALISGSVARLQTFWRQTMALAMLSLAMLYFSVLSFGLIMTSYLKCDLALSPNESTTFNMQRCENRTARTDGVALLL
jgi:hypothetical protein